MNIDVGVVSAALSVLGAIVAGVMTVWSGQRSSRIQHMLEVQRHKETKAEQMEEVLSRYREPLLLSAQSFQNRLHNAVSGDYLPRFLHCGDREQEDYARNFTVYAMAEYLCWAEIIRRELRFLDLGDEKRNREFQERMQAVGTTLSSLKIPQSHFRLFRGQQRAIGELMMTTTSSGAADCMTYPVFCAKLQEPEFDYWFARLRSDVDQVLAHDWNGNVRLVHTQWALVDLIDFLDPQHTRMATPFRQKVSETAHSNLTAPVPEPSVSRAIAFDQ